jgi:uncharacterized membrane protein
MTTTTEQHPVVAAETSRRREDVQLRIADAITAFAGSMLTLFVSLEAIFLSTLVMIGQNRQAQFTQAKANHDFAVSEQELHENTEITRLVQQLTIEIHNHYLHRAERKPPSANGSRPR